MGVGGSLLVGGLCHRLRVALRRGGLVMLLPGRRRRRLDLRRGLVRILSMGARGMGLAMLRGGRFAGLHGLLRVSRILIPTRGSLR